MSTRLFLILGLLFSQVASAAQIEVISNAGAPMSKRDVEAQVVSKVANLDQYSSVTAQVVSNHSGVVDSILVYLRDQNGKIRSQSIQIDRLSGMKNWVLESLPRDDAKAEALARTTTAFCPDESVQFLSVSHRNLPWDQASANQVADAAEQAGLKTVRLLGSSATRQNYLNYMSCPSLIGNFYDGDADPREIAAYDWPISAQDFSIVLKNAFRHHVINVWVACKAFNDPLLSAVVDDAGAQKFIAGKVDLISIYSDRTGVCTMKGAIAGKPVSQSFNECKAQYDLKFHNKWGVAGSGSEILGN